MRHFGNKSSQNQKQNQHENKMEIDNEDNDEQYESYRKEHKLPPKVMDWIANFYTNCSQKDTKIWVTVQYCVFDKNLDANGNTNSKLRQKNLNIRIGFDI